MMKRFIAYALILIPHLAFAGINGPYTTPSVGVTVTSPLVPGAAPCATSTSTIGGGCSGGATPTVPTAPQFDDTTKIANTHWVQQRGEQGSGMVLTSTSGNVTLANAGGRIAMAADGVNVVYTLPPLSSMPDHVPFGLWNVTSPDAGGTGSIFTVTLQTQGGDSINGPGVPGGSTVIIPPLGSIWLQRETIDMGEGPQTIYLVLGDKGSMGLVGGVAGHHYKSLIDYTDQNVTISANQVGSTIRLRYAAGGGQAILPLLSAVEDQSVIKIVSVNCPSSGATPNNVAVHDPVGDETDRITYSSNFSNSSDNLQCGDWEEFTANVGQGTWTALGGPNSMFYSTFWNTPVFENNPRVLASGGPGAVVVQPSAFGQYSVTNNPGPFHTISSESIAQFSSDATIFNSQGVQLVGHHYGTWNPIGGGGAIDEATAGAVNLLGDGGNNYTLPQGTNYAPGQAYVVTSAAAGNVLQAGSAIRVGTTIIANVPLGQYDSAEMVANGEGYSLVGGSALFPYSNYFQNQQITSLTVGSPSGGSCGAGCINAPTVKQNGNTLVENFQPTIFGALTLTTSSGHQTIIAQGDSDGVSTFDFLNGAGAISYGQMNAGPSGISFNTDGGGVELGLAAGVVTIPGLSGSGTRPVVTSNTGVLSAGTLGSGSREHVSFQPGLLTSVTNTKSVFGKYSYDATVNNLVGSAMLFSCISNPTITMYECGTDASCAAPTTIGTVTVTAAGTAVDGTVSNPAITAGDYVAWAITAGTCTSLDISAAAQVTAN